MRPASVLFAALTLLGALSRPASATQANPADSEKLDTLMTITRDIHRTVKNDPLRGKSFGIEFNFLRALLLTEQTSISGGISLFNINRQAELAFPFFYSRSETNDLGAWADSVSRVDFTEFTQDVHFRYFLGNTQNGFYLSGFARGAYLNGIMGQNVFDAIDTSAAANPSNRRASEGKLGLGVGLGYRIFSYRGLYWGTSLNLGRYVLGKNDYFRGGFLDWDNDAELIFDVELLKFGWAF